MVAGEVKRKDSLIVFIVALLCINIVGSSVDIFVPSLPFIHRAFASTMQQTQLIVASYLFASGVFQLVFGFTADSFGRRKTLLLSFSGFVVCTFCVPFSSSIYILLLLRFLQGTFAAGMGVASKTLLSDCFSGTALAKHATYYTFAWAVGPIISPYIGGYLQHLFGWQASFYFLGSYAFIVLIMVLFCLPETASKLHQLNVKNIAVNYLKVYSCWPFVAGALVCGCVYSFITIYNVVGPFLIQRVLAYSPIVYGRIALLLGVAWLTGNLLCRFIITKKFTIYAIYLSLVLGVLISIFMLWLAVSMRLNLWVACIPPLLLFVVGGILFSYCFGKCLSIFPQMGGVASAAMSSLYCIIAAVVSALSTQLESTTLVPLALSYLVVIVVAFVFFYLKDRGSSPIS